PPPERHETCRSPGRHTPGTRAAPCGGGRYRFPAGRCAPSRGGNSGKQPAGGGGSRGLAIPAIGPGGGLAELAARRITARVIRVSRPPEGNGGMAGRYWVQVVILSLGRYPCLWAGTQMGGCDVPVSRRVGGMVDRVSGKRRGRLGHART